MSAVLQLPAEEILAAGAPAGGRAAAEVIGRSRQGREIVGWTAGRGELAVSLIGGCHADEPVGPELLRRLVGWLGGLAEDHPALARLRWRIVPHVNPDGGAVNAAWSEPLPPDEQGFDLAAYLDGVVREAPGDDVEFGFPRSADDAGARPENRAVATFLTAGAPYHLHATLHGMAFAAGPWFLLEAAWVERTAAMRRALARRVHALGYGLHDVDRGGEKGFTRIEEGFSTRPDSGAMRRFFEQRGEPETAALFRPSSMELARRLGGDPLTLVSEMPLFLYWPGRGEEGAAGQTERSPRSDSATGASGGVSASFAGETPPLPADPEGVRRFVTWARRRLAADGPEALAREAAAIGLEPMPLGDQMRLQLALLEEGLAAVTV